MKYCFRKYLKKEVALVLIVNLLICGRVFAQSTSPSSLEGIEVKPIRLNYSLNAGDKSGDVLKIKNTGSSTTRVKLSSQPYGLLGENYEQKFEKLPGWQTAEEWIGFDREEIEVNSSEEKQVFININVPSNATTGGHYAVIFAETIPQVNQSGEINTSKRVGALVYFEVGGDLVREVSASGFNVGLWSRSSAIEGSLRVQNTGNTHALTGIELSAKRIGFGRWNANQEVNIFPGTVRKVDMKIQDVPAGVYRLKATVMAGDLREETDTRWVLVASIWQIALVGLILVAVVLIVRKKRIRGHDKNPD